MELLRKGDATAVSPPNGSDYGWNDILIERLGLSRDEMRIFVDSTLQLGDLIGLPNATALATLRTMSIHDLIRRTQITYDDLVAILQTQFVNPNAAPDPQARAARRAVCHHQGAPRQSDLGRPDVHRRAAARSRLFAIWRADLDERAGCGQLADQRCGLSQRRSTSSRSAIRPAARSTAAAPSCSCATPIPDNTANKLSATDWLKLVRFVRLWRKLQTLLGGDNPTTIQQTDAILAALYPADKLPAKPWDADDGRRQPAAARCRVPRGNPACRLRLPGDRPARGRRRMRRCRRCSPARRRSARRARRRSTRACLPRRR